MIEIVESEAGFDALRDAWNEMARDEAWNSFLWCREAWKCQTGSLRIIVWSRDAQRAIFPFFVDGKGALRLIGDELSDGGDVVCCREANLYWAFREAADAVREMRDVKRVWLMKMPADSQLLAHWCAMWPESVVFKAPATTFLHVPHSDDVVRALPGLKRKDRGRLDAISRLAAGYSFELRSVGEFPRAEIDELRAAMCAQGRRAADFLPEAWVDFAGRLYAAGAAEVPMFFKDGAPQALAFRFRSGRDASPRWLSWICLSRDPHLVSALYLRYIEEKAKGGAFTIDFGTGAYGYKLGTFRPQISANFTFRASKTRLGRWCDIARMMARHRGAW